MRNGTERTEVGLQGCRKERRDEETLNTSRGRDRVRLVRFSVFRVRYCGFTHPRYSYHSYLAEIRNDVSGSFDFEPLLLSPTILEFELFSDLPCDNASPIILFHDFARPSSLSHVSTGIIRRKFRCFLQGERRDGKEEDTLSEAVDNSRRSIEVAWSRRSRIEAEFRECERIRQSYSTFWYVQPVHSPPLH